MNKFILAVAALLLSSGAVFAQAPASAVAMPGAAGCEARAIDKNGKMLAGAARKSFIKKCEANSMDPSTRTCETKAVAKSGKALTGAARSSFMKKCVADAAK